MSKYIILCSSPKKLKNIISNTEKYTVSNTIADDTCDVIYVSKKASVTESDLDMVANMLESKKVVIGTAQKKSALKNLIYRFFHFRDFCFPKAGIRKIKVWEKNF